MTQWKSSDTIATPVASGPTMLSHQNARCTRAGSAVLDGLPARDAPHEHGVGDVPGREGRTVGWKKKEPGKPGAVRPVPHLIA